MSVDRPLYSNFDVTGSVDSVAIDSITHISFHIYLYIFHSSDCLFGNGGFLLENSSIVALKNPEQHSFRCLFDVAACYESGFQVLGDKNPDTDRHCLGFRLDDTDAVLAAGRAVGKSGNCGTCTGGMNMDPEYGYRATVKGTVKELGDGSDGVNGPPMLTNITMLDESVGCDGNHTIPPLCVRSVGVTLSPTAEPTNQPTASAPTTYAPTTAAPTAPTTVAPTTPSFDLKVGDEVCITNYIMDRCEC